MRRYLEIVHLLARREFEGRYRGSLLGAATAVLVPLAFLATYTFVFSTLIPVQLSPEATRTEYAFFLFSGLVGWNLFAETLSGAAPLFRSRAQFVRRALFPISALPVAASLNAFYHSLIWLGVFVAARFSVSEAVAPSAALAPLALALLALLTAGAALAVASLGALIRDLGAWIGPLLALGLFLSPVLYPAERVAGISPWLVYANPLAPPLEALHATLIAGSLPSVGTVAAAAAWSAAALAFGVAVHVRIRPLLADLV